MLSTGFGERMDANTFPSANEAINWAMRRMKTPILTKSTIYSMARKRAIFEWMPDYSPWEKLAEAVYILKAVNRTCTLAEILALETYYLGGTNKRAPLLAKRISRELNRDRWFTLDIVKAWARERPRHTTKWWGRKYGVSTSTISRWQQEIDEKLNILLRSALTGANYALQESGHVEY